MAVVLGVVKLDSIQTRHLEVELAIEVGPIDEQGPQIVNRQRVVLREHQGVSIFHLDSVGEAHACQTATLIEDARAESEPWRREKAAKRQQDKEEKAAVANASRWHASLKRHAFERELKKGLEGTGKGWF